MRLLVDMDDVIADFEKGVIDGYRSKYPDKLFIPKEQRTTFIVERQYPEELRGLVRGIYHAKGFIFSLEPVAGSLDALRELESAGHQLFICTSPLSKYEYCVPEKYQWVERYLGREWTKKLVITRDKTIVAGDILIDDNPDIVGVERPVWEHVLYDLPYNRHIISKRRLTWQNWKSVLRL